MLAIPVMLFFWVLFTVAFVAVMLYRSHLTRQEVDQVFLYDHIEHDNEVKHNDLLRRLLRLRPYVQTTGGAAALLTLALVGVYVANILPTVQF